MVKNFCQESLGDISMNASPALIVFFHCRFGSEREPKGVEGQKFCFPRNKIILATIYLVILKN